MKKLELSILRSLIFTVVGMLVFSACVNEEYDLSKDIDTDMTLLKNVSMPLGNVEKISLSDILSLDEDGTSVIDKDENGYYIFSFAGDEISSEICIPGFDLSSSDGIQTEPVEVKFNTGPFAGLSNDKVSENIVYSELTGKLVQTSMDIQMDSELPEQILDVRSVVIDANVNVTFSVNAGTVYVKEGFEIKFPDFLSISNASSSDGIIMKDASTMVVNKDYMVSSDNPLKVTLNLDKISVPEGSIVNGHLLLNKDVSLTGDFYLSPSDFDVIPEDLNIVIKADILDLDVISSEVKLDFTESIEGSSMSIGDLPDFFTGEDICLDIHNPSLRFSIDNATPLSFDIMADIVASKGDESVTITLGEDPKITIPASSSKDYCISKRASITSDIITQIVIPEISDIISIVPEKVDFKNISLSSANDDYINIITGEKYEAAISYEFYAPLAFDSEMNLSFTSEVKDLGMSLEGIGVRKMEIRLCLENSIPLNMSVSAVALDTESNVLDDITLTVSDVISAGSHETPTTSDIVLTLECTSDSVSFDGLRFEFNAFAPSGELVGVALNENQGFEIKESAICLPEGITIVKQ